MGLIQSKLDEAAAQAMINAEAHMAKMAAGLAEFANGNRLNAARVLPLTGRWMLWGGSGRLVGWSVKATGGPVTLLIRDSRDAEGDVFAVIDLADTEHETVSIGTTGVAFGNGLYVDKSGTGTAVGALWLGARD